MSTVELQEILVDKAHLTLDRNLLNEAIQLLDDDYEFTEIYKLNDGEREEIIIGLNDLENQNFLTNEAANKEIDLWLNA